ncbi:unnamed protein product, partial [Meganyctiphanes norvegica]
VSDTHNMEMPNLPQEAPNNSPPVSLCSRDLLCWSFQIARAMDYLQARKVLHGDLAARNVLLSENNVVKISDFGMAKDMYKNDLYQKKSNTPMPVKWMSVEALQDGIFSTQSDIWAFGVVLWEIFTLGRSPFHGLEVDEHFLQKLQNGLRLEKPKYAIKSIYDIMKNCWALEPTERPSFIELEQNIGKILNAVDKQFFDEHQEAELDPEPVPEYLNMVCSP